MAAHAVALAGQPLVILSRPYKSRLGGAQFLHEPIPELTDDEPDIWITYQRAGNAAMYQFKAYGNGPQPTFVSFDGVEKGMTQPGWNLRKIYDRLWDMYGGQVTERQMNAETLREVLEDELFSYVISSIPLSHLCRRAQMTTPGGHRFSQQAIMILNDKCFGGHEDNTVWYDGTRSHSWYRSSRLFGVESTEWGVRAAADVPYNTDDMVAVQKPLETTCDCWPSSKKFIKVGRFGRWLKGTLAHDGFRSTVQGLHGAGLLELPERIRP